MTHLTNLDIAWILLCSALVFLMQAGFLCIEAGLTQSKNSINVAMKNLTNFAISSVIFWMFGFGIMFGTSQFGLVGFSHFFESFSARKIGFSVYFLYQVMFCGTAVTIFSGGVAERMKFLGYLIVAVLTSGFIYPVFGHWAWGGNFISTSGWLKQLGFIDFAGSTVVHSVGGWITLAALLVIGSRQGRFEKGMEPFQIRGNDLPMSMLGVLLLWFGWMGFNGGSNLHLNENVAVIIINTIFAACSGLIATLLVGWRIYGYPDPVFVINGALAGLVSITASCFAVDSLSAIIIGAIGGLIMLRLTVLMERWQIDDAIGAIPVHAGAGVWGAMAVGIFGDLNMLGTGLSRSEQLLAQLTGVAVCCVFSFGFSYLILRVINKFYPLRVSAENEIIGLNVSEHRSKNEILSLLTMMKEQAQSKDLSLRSEASPFTEVGQIAQHYNIVLDSLQEALGRTEAIVRTAKDAIVTFSEESFQISSVNPSTESTFGYKSLEMMGQPVEILFESGRTELKRIIESDQEANDPDDQNLKVICKRKDGTLVPMEITLVPAKLNGKTFYTVTFHDISQRGIFAQQLEIQTHELRHLNTNLQEQKTIIELIGNVATIANEVASVEEMMSKIMAFVGDYFDWPIGHVYLRDRDNKQDFLSTDIWYVSGPVNLVQFQNSIKSRVERASSQSLIGRAITEASSQWAQQIPEELRNSGEGAIQGHFAFPVLVDSEVVAVVEFFSKEMTGMTQSIQDVMPNLVAQLGRIFERRAVLSKLSESEQVFRSICSLAHDPIVMMDEKGRISFWNQSAEQLFGYVSVEAIGKDLHQLLAPNRYHSQIYQALAHYWKTGEGEIISKPREIMAKKKNGEEILVEIAISAVSIHGKWHAIGIARALNSRLK